MRNPTTNPNLVFAFLSRHKPTQRQIDLTLAQGIELVHIGDRDAFTVEQSELFDHDEGPFDGVIVAHPAAAMRLCGSHMIGVFKNEHRAPIGGAVTFEAESFHIWDLRD